MTQASQNTMSAVFSGLEDADIVKKRNKEANEFRVGVLGPKSCGKSSLVAKLHRLKGTLRRTTGDSSNNAGGDSSSSNSDSHSHLNKVMCVPVRQGHPLGIKIVPAKGNLSTWCCVHSFLPGDMTSQQSAIAADGRIVVGDLLVAIGSTSLLKKSPFEIVSILKAAEYDVDNHLLITFLRPGDDSCRSPGSATKATSVNNMSCSSSSNLNSSFGGSSHYSSDLDCSSSSSLSSSTQHTTPTPQDVYIDLPTVLITNSYFCYTKKPSKPSHSLDLTSYHLLTLSPSSAEAALRSHSTAAAASRHRHRPSVVEIIDLPGNDPNQQILQEWLPRLDAMLLVYSASSTSSLLSLERTYLRTITKLSAKETFELPIVVVCNKSEDSPFLEETDMSPADAAKKLAQHIKRRDTLIMEGRAMAEAWHAPFFITSCVSEGDCGGRSSLAAPTKGINTQPLNSCMHDGFEYIFETAIQQSILHNPEVESQTTSGSHTSTIRNNNLPIPISTMPSLFQFLPFVGQCLSVVPEDNGSVPYAAAGRKLQHIDFSAHRRSSCSHTREEKDMDASSITSLGDDDAESHEYSDSDSDSDSDSVDSSSCENYFGDDRSDDTPPLPHAARRELHVKKKTGHTHNVWKVNFTAENRESLIQSAKKGSNMLSGSQIVGRE